MLLLSLGQLLWVLLCQTSYDALLPHSQLGIITSAIINLDHCWIVHQQAMPIGANSLLIVPQVGLL